jgi:hypothetical protein
VCVGTLRRSSAAVATSREGHRSPRSRRESQRYASISFAEQPRQLLFFGQTCAFMDKLSDKQRCDLRVNEYTA